MKITNIAFGDYLCHELGNDTIKFDALFSIGIINNNIISYNDEFYKLIKEEGIYDIKKDYNLEDNLNLLNNFINDKNKIRIWTSHNQIDDYLMFLFICNYLTNINYENIYVIFSDIYNKDYYSPSCMDKNELEESLKYEHKLTKEEIIKYNKEWLRIVNNNSDMRIINDNKVECVSFNYYDSYILDISSKERG